jgi:hypothetical protein
MKFLLTACCYPRIEDASTAVEMLRMVNVVLVPANNGATGGIERQRIPVPHSPFVRTVCELDISVQVSIALCLLTILLGSLHHT